MIIKLVPSWEICEGRSLLLQHLDKKCSRTPSITEWLVQERHSGRSFSLRTNNPLGQSTSGLSTRPKSLGSASWWGFVLVKEVFLRSLRRDVGGKHGSLPSWEIVYWSESPFWWRPRPSLPVTELKPSGPERWELIWPCKGPDTVG
jgi:hypothetical protein